MDINYITENDLLVINIHINLTVVGVIAEVIDGKVDLHVGSFFYCTCWEEPDPMIVWRRWYLIRCSKE